MCSIDIHDLIPHLKNESNIVMESHNEIADLIREAKVNLEKIFGKNQNILPNLNMTKHPSSNVKVFHIDQSSNKDKIRAEHPELDDDYFTDSDY